MEGEIRGGLSKTVFSIMILRIINLLSSNIVDPDTSDMKNDKRESGKVMSSLEHCYGSSSKDLQKLLGGQKNGRDMIADGAEKENEGRVEIQEEKRSRIVSSSPERLLKQE